jgi:ribosome-binding protein aMBF1 (putative translation factor)
MDGQDWTTVTMKRTPSKPSVQKVAAAQAAVHAARMDSDDVKVKRKRLTTESRQALVAARVAEKKGQRDVDKELAFPPNTIRDFEAGTAAPSGAQISALHRRFAAAKLVLRVEVL